LLTLFFAILQANASYDEPKTYRKQADFKIFFPVNNAVLYAEYKRNAILLDKITQIIDSISAKPNMHFIDFKVCGYSSPDGLESHNILLSIQRMKQIKNFMIKKYGIDPDIIHTSYVAENWQELDSLVRKSNIKRREELLEIIESNRRNDEKEKYIRYHF
jgi:outer membrane protein OmpA-like peptidoglycan-associated protein